MPCQLLTNCGWWWAHFDEHPGIATKSQAAYANLKEKRSKIMCKQCKVAQIIFEQQEDRVAHQQGKISVVWTQEQIIEWSLYHFLNPMAKLMYFISNI